jgi:hypothetical protein
MNNDVSRTPVLDELYQQYLVDEDVPAYVHRTMQRYTAATLGRLVEMGERHVRRAAVLVLGHIGDYESNPVLGRALSDSDRSVRLLAETAIRFVWCRAGSPAQRQKLARLITLNRSNDFLAVLREATVLIREAPWLAEVWNQRAIAHFGLERYEPSARTISARPPAWASAICDKAINWPRWNRSAAPWRSTRSWKASEPTSSIWNGR